MRVVMLETRPGPLIRGRVYTLPEREALDLIRQGFAKPEGDAEPPVFRRETAVKSDYEKR